MSISEFLEHISEKPWSDYTKADYTIEQWHAACLIHLHQGPPTSKDQCKLPIKTPNGALNRNGVHAATAALHGARTPLQAPPDQKAKAALALLRAYHQLGEKPPPSLVHDNLEHHGVKGQKWGVRKDRGHEGEKTTLATIRKLNQQFEERALSPATMFAIHNRAVELNREDIIRINNSPFYKYNSFISDPNSPSGRKYIRDQQEAFAQRLNQAAEELGTNASGTRKFSIRTDPFGTGDQSKWGIEIVDVKRGSVKHASFSGPIIDVLRDKNGKIIGYKLITSMMQSDLEHHGVKGMHWGVRKDRSRVSTGKKRKKRATQRTVFEKSPKRLTEAELNRRIERMQLEKKYNELNKRDIRKGEVFATDVVHNAGKKVLTALVTAGFGFAVKMALDKRFGEHGKGISEMFKIHKK